jgi:DNA-binding HxlR family transcriptional regulator
MPKVTTLEHPIDFDHICPVVYALSLIGQKWKIPILWHLADEGTLRYNELKRGVHGITNIMLTKSLQELEEHQLVERKQYDVVPPRVEYSLTERGQTLIPLLRDLHAWGSQQIEIDRAMVQDEEQVRCS